MSAALANAIRKRSAVFPVERTPAVEVGDYGIPSEPTPVEASLFCCVQPYDGARRRDSVQGVETEGLVRIWVADEDTVIADDDEEDLGTLRVDPGEGGSGPPGDVLTAFDHRWRVIELSDWAALGTFRQYLARDEGAAA